MKKWWKQCFHECRITGMNEKCGVNEVDGMTDMDEWECVVECEMDDCESREGVGGWARCVLRSVF